MAIISLDGIRIKLLVADLNKDGVSGGIEEIQQKTSADIIPIQQQTELGQSLQELNKDELEKNTRMSGIDLRARLHPVEVSSVLALDALVGLGICPVKCLVFTRQKKRLSVSIEGKGRKEIVEVVAGKRELEAKSGLGGFMDRAKGFMGMRSGEQ